MTDKTCIIIVGPTAVGKTDLAVRLAQVFGTDIISADSRQCFRELNIGVAKPSPPALQQVKHYFINSHSIDQEVNAALFEAYALDASAQIFLKNDRAIMVGGTGLYVQAFCDGMDEIPSVLPQVKADINTGYHQFGLRWLQDQIKTQDPEYSQTGEILNPHRLMRALEVKISTGRSILSFQTSEPKKRHFLTRKIGLKLPREILYRHIDQRVDDMVARGLVEEVNELLPFRYLNSLNTVGYRELFEFFDGKHSKEEAIRLIKQHTRHYAKRQLTWFGKDASVKWFSPDQFENILGELAAPIK